MPASRFPNRPAGQRRYRARIRTRPRRDAGDGHLRGELRHGRQAADRASEDSRRQQVPADLDRPSRGGGDPHEAPGRLDSASDDARPPHGDALASSRPASSASRSPSFARTPSTRSSRSPSNGSEIEIDSRPSDAIALAVRSDAPIFADDSVIEESAIEFEHEDDVNEEQIVEEFKKFLDDVKPDDFIPEA